MKKTIFMVFILIILMLGAGIFAAEQTGFLNLQAVWAQISGHPLENDETIITSPIERENMKLKEEKKDLTYNISVLEREKTELWEQVTELQEQLTSLQALLTEQEATVLNAAELAACYQEMKPDAVVKIMDNLADEVVLTILPLLDKKQNAKIIALMDPLRAALITQLLLDKNIQQ